MDKYNGEDLAELFPPKWQLMTTSFFPNKSLDHLFHIADLIQSLNIGIVMLVEVGGKESLQNFNQYFLNNEFEIQLEESNSDRGIDLGYLIRKNLNLKTKLISHKDKKLTNNKKFARGAFELQIFKNDNLIHINFLCHLKSKLNLKRNDFEGRSQRAAEVNYLVEIYNKRQQKYQDIPITIAGDLNGVIYKDDTEQELAPLVSKTNLKDIFEHLNKPVEQRYTYCYFNRLNQVYPMQLDYFLISEKFMNKIQINKTQVLGFQSPYFDTFKLPANLQEKTRLPSDHFPLFTVISYT